MSTHWYGAKKLEAPKGEVDLALFGDLILECPRVCQALTGTVDAEGRWECGPATLMLFYEQGKMKFCLSPKYFSQVCFGVISDVSLPIHSVEQALEADQVEWKARGVNKTRLA